MPVPAMPVPEGASETRPVIFRYRFAFASGAEKEFVVRLDGETLALQAPPPKAPPEWTRLGFHQCSNCPLAEAEHPRCPVALSLVDLVGAFAEFKSHESVQVVVESRDRVYAKQTSLQTAASSLIGLFMVTSGCPVMSRLRPMVDTHLPFMTPAETTYRVLAMYLVAQYFRHKNALPADWDLQGLVGFLEEVQKVNVAFCKRLSAIPMKDASVNALVILSTLGDEARFNLAEHDLSRVERMFRGLMFLE